MLHILLAPFLLSLVLVGIHAYFGLKIIQRGIIFTDLAVGQMAALGSAVSLLFFEGQLLYIVSLCFALLGGGLIAMASRKIVNLEAFIGLLYALGVSGVFILLSRSPHGMEKFQELMAADILFISLDEIGKTALIYGGIGLFIFLTRRLGTPFFQEMIFFMAFAVTVTSSVKLAGVLTVFALLISPALVALRINRGNLIFTAWLFGILVNFSGILLSYHLDLPTGYTLVFLHSLVAIFWLLGESFLQKRKPQVNQEFRITSINAETENTALPKPGSP